MGRGPVGLARIRKACSRHAVDYELIRTSEPLDGDSWNRILEAFRSGESTARFDPAVCYT